MFISTHAHDHPGREDLAKFAYWGTIFVGLPLGFLIICLVLRDAVTGGAGHTTPAQGIIAPSRRAEVFALLLLPAAAAVQLSTGYHYRPGFLRR